MKKGSLFWSDDLARNFFYMRAGISANNQGAQLLYVTVHKVYNLDYKKFRNVFIKCLYLFIILQSFYLIHAISLVMFGGRQIDSRSATLMTNSQGQKVV